jgi:hypothetical protein
VFKNLDANAAAKYEEKAKAIYARARQSDAQTSAFERSAINDFYYDQDDADNMALAAAELYSLTKIQSYLDEGKAYAPPAASEVSWGNWNAFANYRLAELGDETAKKRLLLEASRYERENIWNLPGEYIWGSLHRWIGMANAHLFAQHLQGKELSEPFLGVLDYAFGRNNWGIAMLASADLPHSVCNIYNGIYRLTKAFPTGALSEGPGDKATHLQMRKYFTVPENSPFEEFNTEAGVFYDNADDFMIQESTIGGQGDLLLMLALASAKNLSPKADSGVPASRCSEPSKTVATASPKIASRGPASLFVNRVNDLFFITPSSVCKADSLAVFNIQNKHITTLYKNSREQFIWNTKHIASGIYQIYPSDKSPAITVRK